MLPRQLVNELRRFQRETGIKDPKLDMRLMPDIVFRDQKKKKSSSFHFNFASPHDDLRWKYSTIGFIIPQRVHVPQWLRIDMPDVDDTLFILDEPWARDTNIQGPHSTASEWVGSPWVDNDLLTRLLYEIRERDKGRRGHGTMHGKNYRPHPGAQSDFLDAPWRHAEKVKEDLEWLIAQKRFLKDTLK